MLDSQYHQTLLKNQRKSQGSYLQKRSQLPVSHYYDLVRKRYIHPV